MMNSSSRIHNTEVYIYEESNLHNRSIAFITAIFGTAAVAKGEVVARVICGEPEDYEDGNGNVWVTADDEYSKDSWVAIGKERRSPTPPSGRIKSLWVMKQDTMIFCSRMPHGVRTILRFFMI